MFLIGRILIDAFGTTYDPGQFNPPLLGNPAATNTFGPIIALGIIFVTPHIVKITKAAFKAPKIDLGPIGQAVGVGTATPGRLIGGGINVAFTPHYEKNKQGVQEFVYPHGNIGRALRAFGLAR